MRTVLILLLLANLTLFAYTRLDGGSGGEAVRLEQQVQPDKIKLLAPQEVAALGPAKVAALADVCVEWGPFNDAERMKLIAELEPLGIARLTTQKRVDVAGLWSPTLAAYSTRGAADRRAGELRAANLRDVAVVDAGSSRYLVAIGAFRTEESATAYASELARLGVAVPTGSIQRSQPVSQTNFIVRDPPANVVTRMRELLPGFPGVDLKVGNCER